MRKPSSVEFRESLTDTIVLSFRILALAFIAGIISFSGVVFLIYTTKLPSTDIPAHSIIPILSAINTAVFLIFLVISAKFPRHYLETTSRVIKDNLAIETALMRIRTSFMIRVALLEVCAIFGLIVCFFAIQEGTLEHNIIYACNAIPAMAMIFILAYSFPSKDRIVSWYEEIT